jgi:hypothetical protein
LRKKHKNNWGKRQKISKVETLTIKNNKIMLNGTTAAKLTVLLKSCKANKKREQGTKAEKIPGHKLGSPTLNSRDPIG